MAECKTSVEIIGIVACNTAACAPGNNPICRIELTVEDDCFVVVGHGEKMTDEFARLQKGQKIRVIGCLAPHRWKTPGNITHSTIHIKADSAEVLS